MRDVSPSDTRLSLAPDGPLVGREAELARILSALERTAGGRGRVVLLDGEPGVGKTRLAQEVLAQAQQRGAQVLVGRCFEQHLSVPFFPFTEAVTSALAGAPRALQAEAPQRWPELVHLAPEFTPGAAPRWDDQDTQLRVFRGATSLLHTLAEATPLVLLLDDLHWADAISLALLLYLGRHLQATRILVLGTYRDVEVGRLHPLEEILRELIRQRLVDEVHMRRLDMPGTAALMRAVLALDTFSDDLVALVHGRAEGNPFFTEELLKAFLEQGALSQPGPWDPRVLSEMEVPRSVRSVIGGRVGRLPPSAQELLHLASVLGQEFDLDVLLAASGHPEAAVLDELDAVLRARLVAERRATRRDHYTFAHTLIQQVLYEEVPAHRRRRLHRRVGEALEVLRVGSSLLAAELARHFLAAGETDRALHYAIQAAEHAAARYAHAEAVHHYATALDLLLEIGDEARAAEVRHRLADELVDLNRLDDAHAVYTAALDTFERLGDTIGQALVHRALGRLDVSRFNLVAAATHFEAALRLWPTEREDTELAWLLLDAARAKGYSADLSAGIALAERGLALAERLGDPGLVARALCEVASILPDPRPRSALPLLGRAEALARGAHDWRALQRVYIVRGTAHWLAGEPERALADHQAGRSPTYYS